MKKKFLFLVGLFVLSLIVAVLFFSKQQKPPDPAPVVSHETKDPPKTVRVPNSPSGVVFSYTGEPGFFPESLPLYKEEVSLLGTNQIISVSKKLGFSVSPTIKSSGGTTRYYWNEKEKSFSFVTSSSIQSLSYQKTYSTVRGDNLSDEQIVDLATSFLSSLFPSSASFVGIVQNNASFDGLVILDEPEPSLSAVLFSLLIDNKYPLLAANYGSTISSVVVDGSGVVRSAIMVLPHQLTQTKAVPVLPFNDALKELNNGKGLLLSSQKSDGWGGAPTFLSVSLTNVEVVYVPENTGNVVEPAFLFSGDATNENNERVHVEYLLYATSVASTTEP